jgi:hypothetical protein
MRDPRQVNDSVNVVLIHESCGHLGNHRNMVCTKYPGRHRNVTAMPENVDVINTLKVLHQIGTRESGYAGD